MKKILILSSLVMFFGCSGEHRQVRLLQTEYVQFQNVQKFQTILQDYPEGSEQALAGRFLLDMMPLSDVLAMNTTDLTENIEYALKARQTMPWNVPWDIFLHYVLPHRTSQEPFQKNRAKFYQELAPLCANATTMEEALSRVSIWCLERSQYRPTSRRDLGPLSVIRGGYGRCEEQNILFMAAARAVGLPVRQATVPWWPQADGNHAWVEAWTEDGWHYLETSAPFRHLGATWFTAQTPRMPKVAAYAFGHPPDPHVYRTGHGFALVDSTPTYTNATTVHINVSGTTTPRDVYFSIPSMGSVRPVTKICTTANGEATAVLGPGIFFTTCQADQGLSWALVDTNGQSSVTVQLNAASARPLPAEFCNRFPEGLADTTPPHTNLDTACAAKRDARMAYWAGLRRQLDPVLRDHFEAGDALPAWLELLNTTQEPLRSTLVAFLQRLDDKDRLDCDPSSIPENIALAIQAREQSSGKHTYAEETFLSWVLQPRIYLEPWSDWRKDLWPIFGHQSTRHLDVKLQLVQQHLAKLRTGERGLFGPLLTPGQILACGTITSEAEKSIFATAALRTLGIPARYQHELGGVEYFDGWSWNLLPTETQRALPTGRFELHASNGAEPFRDFGVARIQDGFLQGLDDLEWDQEETRFQAALPAGNYTLIRVTRGANQANAAFTPFVVAPDATTSLTLKDR